MQQVASRLARRERKAPPEGLREQSSGRAPHREDAARGPRKEAPPYETAHAIAQAWADASPGPTLNSRRWVARQLAQTLTGLRGKIPPTVIAGLAATWKQKYAPSTLHTICSHARAMLRDIDARCGTHLEEAMLRPRRAQPRKRTASTEELRALLAHAQPWQRVWLLLMATLGLRFSEALRVSPEHYDPTRHTITIETKGGQQKEFPVTPEIEQLFAIAPTTSGTYVERLRGKHIKRDWMRTLWMQLKHKAGVPADLNPHDLRRTAAVRVYTETHDVLAVKELLGHQKLDTTAQYLKPYEPAAMEAIRRAVHTWTPKGEVN